ncbi:MAG: ATP-binding cassette domain-containing protein, partial [Ilumatobacteraceae bacterium]
VDVTMTAPPGLLTVIAGPSGSGKSTLLMLIAAADRPDAGHIEVDGECISDRSRTRRRRWRRDRLGIVLPQPSANLSGRFDALGNIVWANSLRRGAPRLTDADALARLEHLDLGPVAHSSIAMLSGGEQMRLAFAVAAVGRPSLIVADEPTASLDQAAAARLTETLRRVADEGAVVIVATHDRHIVDVADAVVSLDHGRRIG